MVLELLWSFNCSKSWVASPYQSSTVLLRLFAQRKCQGNPADAFSLLSKTLPCLGKFSSLSLVGCLQLGCAFLKCLIGLIVECDVDFELGIKSWQVYQECQKTLHQQCFLFYSNTSLDSLGKSYLPFYCYSAPLIQTLDKYIALLTFYAFNFSQVMVSFHKWLCKKCWWQQKHYNPETLFIAVPMLE